MNIARIAGYAMKKVAGDASVSAVPRAKQRAQRQPPSSPVNKAPVRPAAKRITALGIVDGMLDLINEKAEKEWQKEKNTPSGILADILLHPVYRKVQQKQNAVQSKK